MTRIHVPSSTSFLWNGRFVSHSHHRPSNEAAVLRATGSWLSGNDVEAADLPLAHTMVKAEASIHAALDQAMAPGVHEQRSLG